MKLNLTYGMMYWNDLHIREQFFKHHVQVKDSIIRRELGEQAALNVDYSEVRNMSLFNERTKLYYVTEQVENLFEKLKLTERFEFSFFNKIPDGKRHFVVGKHRLLRIEKTGDNIIGLYTEFILNVHDQENRPNANYLFFRCVTSDGSNELRAIDSPIKDRAAYLFTRLLIFMFLSDVEEVEVKAGRSHGFKKSGKLLNNTTSDITIVNSKWNITTVRIEGFEVSGHFALRACGIDRSERRIVYIEPYGKLGYKRTAKKEIING